MNLIDAYYQNRINVAIAIDTSPLFTTYAREVLDTKRPVVVMDESITGNYQVSLSNKSKSISHNGIRLSIVGEFRSYENEVYGQFFNRYIEIQPPGTLANSLNGSFNFDKLNLPTSTYYGNTLQAVYAVQIQIKKLSAFIVVRESQFYVVGFDVRAPINVSRNVIGISNLLRFEVYLPNEQVECNSTLIGQIYFVLAKIRIVSLNLQIINQEYYEDEKIRIRNETILGDFQILDGSPARGTKVPFRIFLKNLNVNRFLNFPGSKLLSQVIAKVVVVDSNGQVYSKVLKVSFVMTEPENIEQDSNEKSKEQPNPAPKNEVNNDESPNTVSTTKENDGSSASPNDDSHTPPNTE